MTAREFFYRVSEMRQAQRTYFSTRDQRDLRLCKVLERDIDAEIERVKDIEAHGPK